MSVVFSYLDWTATNDLSSYLSVTAALDFRAFLGGEKVITDYCHSLAVQGGKILQKALGQKGGKEVRIMENEKEELTANMVRFFFLTYLIFSSAY